MKAAKRCLQYLKGTRDLGLTYGRPDSSDRMMVYALESSKDLKDRIVGFIDIDFDSNPYDRKSVADYILYFMGSPITWKSKKMQMTCLSTMESELVAMTEATTQIMNVRHLLTDLLFPPEGPSVLKCDNQSSISFKHSCKAHRLQEVLHERKILGRDYLPRLHPHS